MKALSLLKMPVILVGLATTLVLSPACKAQFEIAPDHFDGTDSWETKAHKAVAPKSQRALVVSDGNHQTSGSHAALPLATRRQSSEPTRRSQASIGTKFVAKHRTGERKLKRFASPQLVRAPETAP